MTDKDNHRVELHLHTSMSGEASMITPSALMQEAALREMKAIAITDCDSVQSFYEIAKCHEKYCPDMKVIYGAKIRVPNGAYATALAKDQAGLKALYKMLSVKTLTYQERRHLLIGAQGSDVLKKMVGAYYTGNDEELRALAADYDYIELRTEEDACCQQENKQIYALGKKLGKPIVAVGNCHYIYLHHKVGKDVLDEVRQQWSSRENMYLRTTEEMLEHYAYLGEEAAYEVVVANPSEIADSIQQADPRKVDRPGFVLKNAEQDVREICEEKMRELYGEQPQVVKRLADELTLLDEKAFSMFILCHRVVKHIQEKEGLYGFRGPVGSTLVSYLLDISDTNPLPAHHRCPNCKHTEFTEAVSGFDLPQKACPQCGRMMIGDGHNIPYETCLGLHGENRLDIDINTTNAMRIEAKRFLSNWLGSGRLAAAKVIDKFTFRLALAYSNVYSDLTGTKLSADDQEWIANMISGVKRQERPHPGGVMLLPEGMEWEDMTPLQPCDDDVLEFSTHCDCHDIEEIIPKLDILSTRYYDQLQRLFEATGTKPEDVNYQDPKVYALFRDLDTCGVPEFSSTFTKGLISKLDSVSFSNLVKVSGMAHGTDVWCDNGERLISVHPFCELIGDRDDVFLTLLKHGLDRETAYRITVETRKGNLPLRGKLYTDLPQLNECVEILEKSDVPQWYVESMRKVHYLFPKAHAAHYTKLAVAFAWFKVNCPEAFYRTSLEYLEVQPYMSYSDEELEIILENLNTYEYESRKERDGVSLLLEARQRGYT